MACPDENQLLAWCRGDAGGAASIAAHLDQCPDCQLLVGVLQTRQAEDATIAGGLPALGTVVNGRYRLLEHVGSGAMGVVFRCFDVELEREVALKLVKGSTDADTRRSGLEEARALARLNHPNVVAVYDAFALGPWDAIAMEFIAGKDLRKWLRDAHARVELEQVLVQATLGLEAAHAAGVVHRDFKPENVMVGQDGRVRVSDFGLSRSHARLGGQRGALTTPAGTPAYMAPELLLGQAATQASDQYALCLTAIEVLTGRRNNEPSLRLPPWSRGVNADPRRRWPSVHELREALAARARRRQVVRVTALLALAAALSFVVAQLKPPPLPDACATLAARTATLAAPASLAQLEAALAPLPGPSAARVLTLMRGHLQRLEALLATSCRSEREAERAQLQHARLACLERTLFNLEALHRTAVGGQPEALATIGYELLQCDPGQRCGDDRRVRAQALTARPTTDTALDVEVEALVAAFEAREHAEVKSALEPLLTRARQLSAPWALATLLSMRAALRHDEGALEAARADLEEGISLAEADGLDLLSFTLSRERLSYARSAEEVEAWLELTRVRARRLGTDAMVDGDLLEASGLGLWNVGDVGGAVERFSEAAKAWRLLLSADDLMVAQVELLEGRGLAELGRFDEARPLLAHAEEVLKTLGPDALVQLDASAARARLELLDEHPAAARGHLERARAVRERLAQPADDAERVAWRWLSSLEGVPGETPTLAEGAEAHRELLALEELERLARGARDQGPAGTTDSPMGWLATAVAARRTGDRATAQRVVDAPEGRTGQLARAHALVTLGRRAEALALVEERLAFPQRPVK